MFVFYPDIVTPRMRLRVPKAQDARRLAAYYRDNREFLQPWEPTRTEQFFQVEWWAQRIEQVRQEFRRGQLVMLIGVAHQGDEVLCCCSYSNIIYGVFNACHLGYSVSQRVQGQGLMQEMLEHSLPFVYENMGLRRVMANYMPRNQRSAALLARLGFEKEGYARQYLKINGKWEDHVLTSLMYDDWRARRRQAKAATG